MFKKVMAAGAVSVISLAGASNAATLDFELFATIASNNTNGDSFLNDVIGSGTVEVADNVLAGGTVAGSAGSVSAVSFLPGIFPDFDFSFTLFPTTAFEQTFSDLDDPDAQLFFADGGITGFSLAIEETGTFGVDVPINNPVVLSFSTIDNLFFDSNGVNTLNASIVTIADANPIPLPASAFLLLAGLAGLGVAKRRKRA